MKRLGAIIIALLFGLTSCADTDANDAGSIESVEAALGTATVVMTVIWCSFLLMVISSFFTMMRGVIN